MCIHEVYFYITLVPTFLIFNYFDLKRRDYIKYYFFIFILLIFQFFFKGNIYQIDTIKGIWSSVYVKYDDYYLRRLVSSDSLLFWWEAIKTIEQKIGFFLNNILIIIFILNFCKNGLKQFSFFCLLAIVQNVIFYSLCMIAVDYSRWYFLLFTSFIISVFCFYKEVNIGNFVNKYSFFNFIFRIIMNIVEKISPYKYLLYLLIGVPFGGWTFNFYYHSMPIIRIIEFIKPYLY